MKSGDTMAPGIRIVLNYHSSSENPVTVFNLVFLIQIETIAPAPQTGHGLFIFQNQCARGILLLLFLPTA